MKQSANASAAVLDRPSAKTSDVSLAAVARVARLYDAEGRFSAKNVADLFGVSLSHVARILGRSRQAVSQAPTAASLQEPLAQFARVAALRAAVPNEADFRAWLKMPQSLLENRSPLHWIEQGRVKEIGDLVDDILTGSAS